MKEPQDLDNSDMCDVLLKHQLHLLARDNIMGSWAHQRKLYWTMLQARKHLGAYKELSDQGESLTPTNEDIDIFKDQATLIEEARARVPIVQKSDSERVLGSHNFSSYRSPVDPMANSDKFSSKTTAIMSSLQNKPEKILKKRRIGEQFIPGKHIQDNSDNEDACESNDSDFLNKEGFEYLRSHLSRMYPSNIYMKIENGSSTCKECADSKASPSFRPSFCYFNDPFLGWTKEIAISISGKRKGKTSVSYLPPDNKSKLTSLQEVETYFSSQNNKPQNLSSFKFSNLYCVCHSTEEFNRSFIECSFGFAGCRKWVHPECVGLGTLKEPQIQKIGKVICPLCAVYLDGCKDTASAFNDRKIMRYITIPCPQSTKILPGGMQLVESSYPPKVWGFSALPGLSFVDPISRLGAENIPLLQRGSSNSTSMPSNSLSSSSGASSTRALSIDSHSSNSSTPRNMVDRSQSLRDAKDIISEGAGNSDFLSQYSTKSNNIQHVLAIQQPSINAPDSWEKRNIPSPNLKLKSKAQSKDKNLPAIANHRLFQFSFASNDSSSVSNSENIVKMLSLDESTANKESILSFPLNTTTATSLSKDHNSHHDVELNVQRDESNDLVTSSDAEADDEREVALVDMSKIGRDALLTNGKKVRVRLVGGWMMSGCSQEDRTSILDVQDAFLTDNALDTSDKAISDIRSIADRVRHKVYQSRRLPEYLSHKLQNQILSRALAMSCNSIGLAKKNKKKDVIEETLQCIEGISTCLDISHELDVGIEPLYYWLPLEDGCLRLTSLPVTMNADSKNVDGILMLQNRCGCCFEKLSGSVKDKEMSMSSSSLTIPDSNDTSVSMNALYHCQIHSSCEYIVDHPSSIATEEVRRSWNISEKSCKIDSGCVFCGKIGGLGVSWRLDGDTMDQVAHFICLDSFLTTQAIHPKKAYQWMSLCPSKFNSNGERCCLCGYWEGFTIKCASVHCHLRAHPLCMQITNEKWLMVYQERENGKKETIGLCFCPIHGAK